MDFIKVCHSILNSSCRTYTLFKINETTTKLTTVYFYDII